MVEAVLVSVARTPIGKATRGAYADVHPATMAGHVIRHAVQRAGIEAGAVDEVVNGTAISRGPALGNLARQAALRAGPDRGCATERALRRRDRPDGGRRG